MKTNMVMDSLITFVPNVECQHTNFLSHTVTGAAHEWTVKRMDDLIDRKVLLSEMGKLYNKRAVEAAMTGNRACGVTWNDAVYLVTIAPTIEAVPLEDYRSMEQTVHKLTQALAEAEPFKKVVRCKDCKHWDNHDGGERCLNSIYLSWAKPENSCNYGERKDEVEE